MDGGDSILMKLILDGISRPSLDRYIDLRLPGTRPLKC